MHLSDQLRRYFGTDDLAAVPESTLSAGLNRMQVDLRLERDRARRFALWTLMPMLGAAPELDAVFKNPEDRDAAWHWMDLSEGGRPTNEAGGLPPSIDPIGCHNDRARRRMTPDQERWAEAFAIDRQHGMMAPAIIEERIRTLALAGDEAGVTRWQAIAARYDQLRAGTIQ